MSAFIHDRRALRRTAAGLCGVMAAIYVAIAAGATSIEPTEEMSLVGFGIGAASIFGVGAGLLLRFDNRLLWAVGAAMQLMIGAMYLAVSTDRTPSFEAWGLGLRVLQVPLFVILLSLALRSTRPADDVAEPAESTRRDEPTTVPSAGA